MAAEGNERKMFSFARGVQITFARHGPKGHEDDVLVNNSSAVSFGAWTLHPGATRSGVQTPEVTVNCANKSRAHESACQ